MIETLSGEMCYVYEAIGETDLNKFKGGTYVIGYFLTQKEAEQAVKESGNYPAHRYVKAIQVLRELFTNSEDKYYLINKIEVGAESIVKARALAKLTSAEKKVLGLE